MNTTNNPFGFTDADIIASYTRAEALADGFQIDVSETAREAGFKCTVYLNRTVYDTYVKIPEGVKGQDEAGRLWDILSMLHFSIMETPATKRIGRLTYSLYVRNDPASQDDFDDTNLVHLVATCGPVDINDPRPAITVMLPDED